MTQNSHFVFCPNKQLFSSSLLPFNIKKNVFIFIWGGGFLHYLFFVLVFVAVVFKASHACHYTIIPLLGYLVYGGEELPVVESHLVGQFLGGHDLQSAAGARAGTLLLW